MANPKLLGKRMMTVNLIQSDVDVAQQLAQARGTTTSAIHSRRSDASRCQREKAFRTAAARRGHPRQEPPLEGGFFLPV
jgi:hypothetical protein